MAKWQSQDSNPGPAVCTDPLDPALFCSQGLVRLRPWVERQNRLESLVTDSTLCPGWRQLSGVSHPTPNTESTTGRQQEEQVERAEKPGHEASKPQVLNFTFPCPGEAVRPAPASTRHYQKVDFDGDLGECLSTPRLCLTEPLFLSLPTGRVGCSS